MLTIYTIGHSTRSITEFIDLLKEHSIHLLVDVRSIPGSRRNPQFGQAELEKSLAQNGIDYVQIKELGGLRSSAAKSNTESVNDAWRNKSFRNYADYMQTDEFITGIKKLLELANTKTTVIMCAEAVPWRCHRNLVSDALVARKITVCEIIGKRNTREHTLIPFAVVSGTRVTYPQSAIADADNT